MKIIKKNPEIFFVCTLGKFGKMPSAVSVCTFISTNALLTYLFLPWEVEGIVKKPEFSVILKRFMITATFLFGIVLFAQFFP